MEEATCRIVFGNQLFRCGVACGEGDSDKSMAVCSGGIVIRRISMKELGCFIIESEI